MTLQELAMKIFDLPLEDQNKAAVVYPPRGCPSTTLVPVDCLDRTGSGAPVILTGKTPLAGQ
jgi:hypothetical protein